MSGLTWARTDKDDSALKLGEMSDSFLKITTRFQAEHSKPLKAVKLSRLTLLSLPLMPTQEPSALLRFYGVPIEIDDSLALWEFREVYA